MLAGDACGGICADRSLGLYRLQYTAVPNPDETTPEANWIEIGTLDYQSPGGDNFGFPHRRHRYNFDPVMATGIRIIVPATGLNGGTAIDEIELYDLPLKPPPPAGVLAIDQEPGFTIHWNGNDGDNFDPTSPPGGAIVPDNAALATNGAVSFSSSDLGPELGIGFHVVANLNDGFYGNSNSWIGGDANPFAPVAFAGVAFNNSVPIKRIAWGRDNGNGQFDDSESGTDACGGQCDDRSTGTYRLQYTTVASPDEGTADTGDAATGWATIGSLGYNSSQDTMPGGGFTSYLRHEYDVRLDAGPINATGIRIVVPSTGLGGGTGIDEIEVYTDDFVPAIDVDPAPGFSIVWDGNDGDHFNPNDPAPAPDNLVLSTPGMTAFGSGEVTPGAIDAVADGFYGDASSWTSDGASPAFVGLGFGESLTFDHVAFGRDNGNDADPGCPGGQCTDNALGGYTIQITALGNPGPATADTGSRSTGWETIGRAIYNESSDTFTPHLRHEFIVLDGGLPITATGLRIVLSDPALTIDEIELSLTPEPTPVVIEAAAGFDVTWDGNDGEFFDPGPEAAVPENLALAASGTTPFASGELGSQIGLPYHLVENLNDGLYGNGKGWIGGSADNPPFAGLDLGGLVEIDRIAWGRDNGRLTPTSEECGGTCPDRSLGLYTLQHTTVASPGVSTADTGNADTGWQTVGQISYDFEEDNVVGGGFTAYLRHEFAVRQNGGLLGATGIRLLTPAGTAIDELEVYGPEEPDVAFAAALTATEILADPAEIVISEVAAAIETTFWLEIGNQNPQSVDLTGYVLASSDASKTPYVLPTQVIAGSGFVQISETDLGFDVVEGERLFLYGPGQATLADAVIVDDVPRARSTDHGGRWLYPDVATPGAANSFVFEQDIVINEIFYHAPGTATSDVPATFTSSTLVPIDANTEWRYRDVASGLPSDWATTVHSVGIDDWKAGPGLIGFETAALAEPIRTQVSNPPATFPFVVTYYFEREFELVRDPNTDNLEVAISHFIDDGAVFYVNGDEFLRVNMTSGPFDASTFAASSTGNAAKSEPVVIPKELLVPGTNRISVEVHQGSASSSDVVFGAEIIERRIITPFIPGKPFAESAEEWIELYNRSSTRTVDLTGWSLDEGVDFEFPPGTMIGPNQYVLVARNADELQSKHPALTNIVGQYDGGL
ncbi:MAG: lamin tail domain-containing protein, partial [Planctomycetota bacterium]